MPRFFFHIDDGVSRPDPDGVDLPGLDAAREQAAGCLAELLRNADRGFSERSDWLVRVTDETGLVFFTLHFSGVGAPPDARRLPYAWG